MSDKLDSIMDEFDDSLWAMAAEIERLRAERDEAREACKKVSRAVDSWTSWEVNDKQFVELILLAVKPVIAKTKSEADHD